MTNSAMVVFIKKFMELDEDYVLKEWSFHFDKTDTIKFSGGIVPMHKRKKK